MLSFSESYPDSSSETKSSSDPSLSISEAEFCFRELKRLEIDDAYRNSIPLLMTYEQGFVLVVIVHT